MSKVEINLTFSMPIVDEQYLVEQNNIWKNHVSFWFDDNKLIVSKNINEVIINKSAANTKINTLTRNKFRNETVHKLHVSIFHFSVFCFFKHQAHTEPLTLPTNLPTYLPTYLPTCCWTVLLCVWSHTLRCRDGWWWCSTVHLQTYKHTYTHTQKQRSEVKWSAVNWKAESGLVVWFEGRSEGMYVSVSAVMMSLCSIKFPRMKVTLLLMPSFTRTYVNTSTYKHKNAFNHHNLNTPQKYKFMNAHEHTHTAVALYVMYFMVVSCVHVNVCICVNVCMWVCIYVFHVCMCHQQQHGVQGVQQHQRRSISTHLYLHPYTTNNNNTLHINTEQTDTLSHYPHPEALTPTRSVWMWMYVYM